MFISLQLELKASGTLHLLKWNLNISKNILEIISISSYSIKKIICECAVGALLKIIPLRGGRFEFIFHTNSNHEGRGPDFF